MRRNYRIDSVLCLVDAKNILTQLERKSKEASAVNEAVQQLAFADSVIINKTDLVDEAHLKTVKGKIASVNPFAKVVQAEKVWCEYEYGVSHPRRVLAKGGGDYCKSTRPGAGRPCKNGTKRFHQQGHMGTLLCSSLSPI